MAARGAGAFASPGYDFQNATGSTRIYGAQSGSAPQAPLTLAQVAPRITGASAARDIVLSFASLTDVATGATIAADAVRTFTVRRGDAKADGLITIADALFIAQTLAGVRDVGEGPTLHSCH